MMTAVVFAASFVLTYLVRVIAIKKSLLDIPNARSSHTVPTPHGGGIAIAISWFGGLWWLLHTGSIDTRLFYALITGAVLSIISFLDDIYDLNPKLRLIIQFLVGAAGLYILGGLKVIDLYFFKITSPYITNAIAVFAIVWFINLYNFLDGIDGYAGSEALFLSFAGYMLFGCLHYMMLGAAVLGFLVWNWHKAKIFMGDTGSTLLGYNVAIFTIFSQNSGNSVLMWLILFGYDATVTLIRRRKHGEKLSIAHKKHAYQRLNQSGWRPDEICAAAMLMNLLLFLPLYLNVNLLLSFLLAIVLLYLIMKYIDRRKAFE